MLKAISSLFSKKEAAKTPCNCMDGFATIEDVNEALEEHMKQITYEWNEWYEKFEKLHLRLARRDSRKQQVIQEQQVEAPLSVLPYRRITSV